MSATRSLNVTITGDDKPLGIATKKVGSHLDDVEKRGKKMGKALAFGFGAAGVTAAGALVLGLKKSADAATESEKSSAKLKAQLDASNISYRKHGKEIDAVIQKHSRLAGVDDEDLQDAFTGLVRSTGSVNTAMKDMGLVTDLMRGKNMDAAKAGDLLSKVHNGNVTALKKMGIAIDPVTKAQDKLKASNKNATAEQVKAAKAADKASTAQKGIAELQKRFGGQAEAYGKTAAGAQDRFAVAMENVQEKLGAKLLPVLGTVANGVSKFLSQIDQGTGAGGKFADIVSGAFGKVKGAIESAIPTVVMIFNKIKDAVQASIPTAVAVFGKLKGAITDIISTVSGLVRGFQDGKGGAVAIGAAIAGVTAAFTAYKVAMVIVATTTKVVAAATKAYAVVQGALNVVMSANPIGLVVLALVGLGTALVVAYKKSETFRGIVDGVFKAVKSVVGSVMDWLVPKVKTAFGVVADVVRAAVKVVKGVLSGMGDVVKGVVEVVRGVLSGDFKKAWDGVKSIVRGALKVISSVIRGLWEPLGNAMVSLAKLMIRKVVSGLAALPGALKDAIVSSVEWAAKNVPKLIGKALKGLGGAISAGISAGFKKLNPFGDGFGDGTGMITGAGGAGLAGGSLMGAKSIMSPFASLAGRFGLHTSSGLRPGAITSSGNPSFHGSGNAVDEADGVPGPSAAKLGYFRYLKAVWGPRLRELIYTPGGQGIKDGKPYTYTGQVAADHFDHVHVAFTGGAGDGIGRTGDGPGDRKKQLNWMQGVWGQVAPALGQAAGAVPSYFKKVEMDRNIPFAGVAWDSEARKGTPDLLWPRWVWADTPGQKALDPQSKTQLFVHEMAHRFQKRGQVGEEWESEGGAEAFARREMDSLFGGRVVGKGDPYTPFVHRVEKDKGAGWILGTQFGRKPGTGDGLGYTAMTQGWKNGAKQPMSPDQVAALAESVGLPGVTFQQIAKGESGYDPDNVGHDPGGTTGLGLWQITTKFNDDIIRKYGGPSAMFDPQKNALAARDVWKRQGKGAWYGTRFVTGWDQHYKGSTKGAGSIGSVGASGGGKGKSAAPSFSGFTLPSAGSVGAAAGGLSLGSQIGGIRDRARGTGGAYDDGGATGGQFGKGTPSGYTPPEPAGTDAPSEFDYLDANLAQAQSTETRTDDVAPLQAIGDFYFRALQAAQASGDPRRIAQARRDLTGAEAAIKENSDALTANTAATEEANRLQEQRDQLNQQIADNQLKILALVNQGPQIVAAVVAAVSGGIGGQVGLGMQSPGYAGGVARY